jgi:hypothetical protein
MTTEAWTPTRAATRLTKQLNAFAAAHGTQRFPVDVTELAKEAANLFQWSDPITEVEPVNLSGLEGALFSDDGRKRWKLLYNSQLSPGRIRFTQAHELGHYILHRMKQQEFKCTEGDMLEWDEAKGIESQADVFASYLLMPLDDFRSQIGSNPISLDLLSHCADRYGTSLTATILKWIECTEESAVFLMSREGYIDWARSSKRAMEAGAFFRTRKDGPIAVPAQSYAADTNLPHDVLGTEIASSIWFPSSEEHFPILEMKLTADQYDYTLTLLRLPRFAKVWAPWRPDGHP